MRRYMLIALLVLLAGCFSASRAEAVGQVTVDIFGPGHFTSSGDGSPFIPPPALSFTSPDVQFGASTGFNWHPGGLADFGADFNGPMNVASTGTYTFKLTSDDGSRLFIDGLLLPVVDNGGAHSQTDATGSILLGKGLHSFEVRFFECCDGPSGVDLTVPEGITLTPEPSTLLLMAPGMVGMAWYWRRRKIA